MKKFTVSQVCNYGLAGIISITAVLSTNNHVLAQTVDDALIVETEVLEEDTDTVLESGHNTNQTIDFVSPYINTPQASPPKKIQPAVRTVKTNNQCSGATIIEGETPSFVVKVCKQNNQFLYIGKSKKQPNKPIQLSAKVVGKSKYKAQNGKYSYLVSPDGVEVWLNGRKIRSDRFYVSKVFND